MAAAPIAPGAPEAWAASVAIRTCALATSQSPRSAGTTAATLCTKPNSHTRSASWASETASSRVHHGVVPGSEAVLGVRQVAQALAGGAQRDTGAQPRRRGGKIGDRPGQVLGQDPDHAPHDERVGVLPRHLGGGGGQERQPGQALGSPPIGEKGDRQHAQGLVAHGGRGGAGRRRPLTPFDRLRDPARDQAQHRQLESGRGAHGRVPGRVVGLPRLQQAGLGRSGPAREEIQRAQQPAAPRARPGRRHPGGKDLRLGHLAVDDQDLQRVQQTAIGRRRLAADRRRLRQPGRRLRRPAQVAGLPAGRLQLAGQPVVRADRRRHPVPQRPVPVHQARRPLVQPAPPGRAQIAVDGPLHQQMGEPDPGRGPARLLDQDPRRHRLPQGRQRITQARQRGRRRQLAVVAQHRRRHHQLPGRRAQRAHPQQHHPGQRPRHPQRPAEPVKALDPELLQHRPAVQRVTARLLQQTAGGAARQLARPPAPGPAPPRPPAPGHPGGPGPPGGPPPGNAATPHPAGPARPARADTTTSTRSACRRRTANSNARADGPSAHCRSSITASTIPGNWPSHTTRSAPTASGSTPSLSSAASNPGGLPPAPRALATS